MWRHTHAGMQAIGRLTQLSHKMLWCMPNEKRFNVHMEMTEHEFKVLHCGLGISKSSTSWARLPWPVPHPRGHAGPPLCSPWGTQPVLRSCAQPVQLPITINLSLYLQEKMLSKSLCLHEHKCIYRHKTNGTRRLCLCSRAKAWILTISSNKIQMPSF